MRISDWSSDVCSSDLFARPAHADDERCFIRHFDHLLRNLLVVLIGPIARSLAQPQQGCLQPLRLGSFFCEVFPCLNHCFRLRSLYEGRIFQPLGKRVSFLRSEEHTSELQSLMRISYAVFCLKTKKNITTNNY